MTTVLSERGLAAELEDLRGRLAEAEEVVRAIRNGEVDAVVVAGERGEQVYTLSGADRVYRQLIETMSEGAVTLSADGVILYGNARLAEMLGRPLERVIGTALRTCLPPTDQQALDAVLAQARTEPSRREICLQTGAGRLVPVYLSASPIQSEGAETVFCLVLTDLTEQKRYEQLIAAERLARLILEQAAEAIVVCDEQGRVVRASQAAQWLCDGSPLLRSFAEVFALRTDASEPFDVGQVLQGETLRNVDVALDWKGQKLDLILNAAPLRNARQILGCVVTLTNITEHRRAEAALRESHERFRLANLATFNVIWDWDLRTGSLWWNENFREFFGYGAEEIEPGVESWTKRIHPEDLGRVTTGIHAAIDSGRQFWSDQYRVRRKDGSYAVVDDRGYITRTPDGTPVRMLGAMKDVTERKRAEDALRESERAFRETLRHLDEAYYSVTPDGLILDHNLAFNRILGIEAGQDLRGRRTPDFWLNPDDRQAYLNELMTKGLIRNYLVDVKTASGEKVVGLFNSHLEKDEHGRLVRIVGTFTDFTERQRAEEEIRSLLASVEGEKTRLSTLIGSITDEVWFADTEKRLALANPSALRESGFAPGDAIGVEGPTNSPQVLRPDGSPRPLDECPALRALSGEVVRNQEEILPIHASGEFRYRQVNAAPVRDASGGIVGSVSVVRDITEQKLAQERIVHLNRVLRAVRDVNQLIVRERDHDLLIERVCKLLVEGRGYRSALAILTDAAGVPQAFAMAGMEDVSRPLGESLRRGVLPSCCRLAQQREGVCHVEDRAGVCAPCPGGAGYVDSDASCIQLRHGGTAYGYLAVSVDKMLGTDPEEDSLLDEVAGDVAFALHGIERGEAMTLVERDRDRAESELRQSQKMEGIGRLAGGVAHDFNNMLTVINTSCSFLEDDLRGSEAALDDVHTIREAADSAARLTRQLLAFSHRQVLEPRPLDLNALVGNLEKMLNRLLSEDISIHVEPAPALGLVLADPGQLEQVVVNLAVNARDAMPEGGTLTISTADVELDEAFVGQHPGAATGAFVKLAVTDTGEGMDAEVMARMFEPFFTTKEVGRGTGLGLSTVYGIVKQSNGYITADSQIGRGSGFEIYLPRVEPAGHTWRPPSQAGSSRGRGETILLVEDNDQLRKTTARALRKLGYRVCVAAGLDEARRIAATESEIRLVLTDMVMPGGSGHDVSTVVTAGHPNIKVLYMSGFTDHAIVQRGALEPNTAFLDKPFTPESLGRKVRQVLDG